MIFDNTTPQQKSEPDIYIGKMGLEYYEDYIDFINYVFGFNGNSEDFNKLLPKLYKPKYNPMEQAYLVLENKKIKAAIGAFDFKYRAFDTEISIRGIGNVAVHPYTRSKGYMKALMNMAIDDMINDNVDLSVLGGRRQRYNYFSYEKCGSNYFFSFVNDNFRHCFGKERKSAYKIIKVSENDEKSLKNILDLINKQVYGPIREAEKLYDILVSWKNNIYAAYDKVNENFVGYCVSNDEKISELLMTDSKYLIDFIISYYDFINKPRLIIVLPEFRQDYIRQLYKICESYHIETNKSYSILNYKKIIMLLMNLKAKYCHLPSGNFNMLIHGRAGDENLSVTVSNNLAEVTNSDSTPDVELEHIDAMNFLLAPCCPLRMNVPDHVKLWFPLPIWIYSADNV